MPTYSLQPSPLARYALVLYAAVVVYASLYPFAGWDYRGIEPWAFVTAPWPRYITRQDITLNVLGYVPLGFFLVAAMLPRLRGLKVVLAATVAGLASSFALEAVQSFMPQRISSNVDWGLNTAGAFIGAALAALVIPRLRASNALYAARHQWFSTDASYGLLLLGLWPAALLYPQPVLFGTGNVIASLGDWLSQQTQDIAGMSEWLAGWSPAGLSEPQQQALPALACILLGLVISSIAQPRAPRTWLTLAALAAGAGATTLSHAMSYGPINALEWLSADNIPPLVAGSLIAIGLSYAPPRIGAVAGLAIAVLLLAMMNQLPEDPYYDLNLRHWQQGRWIRLHGLAHWLSMLWPFAVTIYLFRRAVSAKN
jgi:VanZ family protein